MKDLILVRHAKSSWQDPGLRDHERPLNKRGERNAPDMGERLLRHGCDPDLFISSSAVRALETARTIAGILRHPPESVRVEDSLYHAGYTDLLHAIRSVDDSVDTLMVVGHNPGLTFLANQIGPRRILNMPTCAVLHLRFRADTWANVGDVRGEEVLYDYPKRTSS